MNGLYFLISRDILYVIMKKSFKYRIDSGTTAIKNAKNWLILCNALYNRALEQRISAYKNKKPTTFFKQCIHLTQWKKSFTALNTVGSQTLQDVLDRMNKAYKNFFRRVKQGAEEPGFPRFKSIDRYDSFTLKQAGWRIEGRKLFLKNIGTFKMRMTRPIQGDIKTVTISRKIDKWYVSFSCNNVPDRPLSKTGEVIGIDVGCEHFLTDSFGKNMSNPRFLNYSQRLLVKRQRSLSRKKLRSNKRKKARILLGKVHHKISNQRRDFHFKTALDLVRKYDLICHEKFRSFKSFRGLNRSMHDVAWQQFFDILRFKAEEAGKEIIKVPAKNTTQECCLCQTIVPKTLNVRIHDCPSCGTLLPRDHNSALDVLRIGLILHEAKHAL